MKQNIYCKKYSFWKKKISIDAINKHKLVDSFEKKAKS